MPRKLTKRPPGTNNQTTTKSATDLPSGQPPQDPKRQDSIVFFHPDLGIGGAERLVVDAAVGLQSRGHKVVIFTNHCDPNHCFDECHDGTLDVRVRANRIVPPSIFARLTILCAILRHVLLLLQIAVTGELSALHPRAFIVDQLSAGLPLLRLLQPASPILFYCHFPDLLLVRGREATLKRLYRIPFDILEEWSMSFASVVAVNSNFTKDIVSKTWPGLSKKSNIEVVYPCVDTEVKGQEDVKRVFEDDMVILSINRFERKKDIGLAIKAFAALPESQRASAKLVLAGGYDPRISENVQYHTELQTLASSLNLHHHTATSSSLTNASIPPSTQVLFLPSIPNTLKSSLLSSARLLIYTPSNEHFGIVPLEAMLARVPVLAADTGGPVETIVDGETGWLRAPDDVSAWTEVLVLALGMADGEVRGMGEEGRRRVKRLFGRDGMAENLEGIVDGIVEQCDKRRSRDAKGGKRSFLARVLNVGMFFGMGMAVSIWFSKLKQ